MLERDLLRSPPTTEGDRRAANSGPQGCQPRDQTPDGVSGETGLENMPRHGVPAGLTRLGPAGITTPCLAHSAISAGPAGLGPLFLGHLEADRRRTAVHV
jgi:hypothetical protein